MTAILRRPPLAAAALAIVAVAAPLALAQLPAQSVLCGTAQDRGCATWTTTIGGDTTQLPYELLQSPDGARLYAIGLHHNASWQGIDAALWTFDSATGEIAWSFLNHEEGMAHPTPSGAVVSPDGSLVFVALTVPAFFGGAVHATIHALDATTGQPVWATNLYDWGAGNLVTAPDGKTVYYAGVHWLPRATSFATAAIDASTGEVQWTSLHDPGPRLSTPSNVNDDDAHALALSPDGTKLVVAGHSTNATAGTIDTYALAYDASDGNLIWTMREPGIRGTLGSVFPSAAYDVQFAPDGGRLFILGMNGLAAHDPSTGVQLWRPPFGDHGCRLSGWYSCDLDVYPDGSVVAAWADDALNAFDAHTGDLLWSALVAVEGSQTDGFVALNPTASTVYLLTRGGKLAGVPDTDESNLEAYDARTGAQLWRVGYSQDDRHDLPRGVTVAPDGDHVYALTMSLKANYDLALASYPTNIGLRADDLSPAPPTI